MTDLNDVWNAVVAGVTVGVVWFIAEKAVKIIRNKIKNRKGNK